MSRTLSLLIALGLVLAACGNGAEGDTTTTTTTTTPASTTTSEGATTTSEATTTTSDDPRPRSPINGLPVDEADLLERRVVAVKIDNHPRARPQSGIQESDGMMEIRVEGGLTRFIALFHHSDSEFVGPIRSARPADAAVIRPLEAALAISGGQAWVRAGINALGVEYLSDPRPGMFRVSGRNAPHNLYGNTLELRDVADDRGIPDDPPPTSLWEFGPLPESAAPATETEIVFSDGIRVTWTWDGMAYQRELNGEPSEWRDADGNQEQISADVLVVIVGDYFTASPPGGQSGSSVPATDTVGSGRALVFAGGEVAEGTWERDAADAPFTLTTTDGEPLLVPPGHPWVSIVPDVGSVEWTS